MRADDVTRMSALGVDGFDAARVLLERYGLTLHRVAAGIDGGAGDEQSGERGDPSGLKHGVLLFVPIRRNAMLPGPGRVGNPKEKKSSGSGPSYSGRPAWRPPGSA